MMRLINATCALCLVASCTGQFVTLEGRTFKIGEVPFFPMVMNYDLQLASPEPTVDANTAAAMYVTPTRGYGQSVESHWECMGTLDCAAQFMDDLDALTSLGFNTVRFGIGPFLRLDGGRRYTLDVAHVTSTTAWHPSYTVDLEPTFDGPVTTRFFQTLREALDVLHSRGMKAILIAADDASQVPTIQLVPTSDQDASDQYAAYLGRLALALRDHPALLAYDLWNEPIWTTTDYSMVSMTKEVVCDHTTRWYDAIRANDPNHLITLGGYGYAELFSWDPAVMKLDFYSPHLYPEPIALDNYDLQQDLERQRAHMHWLSAASPMPWLIGETAFSAEDDLFDPLNSTNANGQPCHISPEPAFHRMPWMHGSEAQQREYALQSLDATHQLLGSGYSWWGFQNTRPSFLCQTPYASGNPAHYRANFWGLYKFGNDVVYPGNPPWDIPHVRRPKLVVDALDPYISPPTPTELPPPPPAYTQWFATPQPITHEYTVRDQSGEPIPYAAADAHWKYAYAGEDPGIVALDLWRAVFADGNGVLRVSDPPPAPPNYSEGVWESIQISATGATDERRDRPFIWLTGSDIQLTRTTFEHSASLSDDHIVDEPTADRKAWNDLTVSNSTVVNSGTTTEPVIFHARQTVHLTGEVHVVAGSEFHAFTGPTFAQPCDQPAFKMARANVLGNAASVPQNAVRSSTVQLKFMADHPRPRLYPNPCKEFTWLDLGDEAGMCEVHDLHGRIVHRTMMNAGKNILPIFDLSSGSYVVHITQATTVTSLNLTKLP